MFRISFLASLFSIALTLPVVAQEDTPQTPDADKVTQQIIEQTNEFRKEQKLPAVKENKELIAAAKYFVEFMASTDKYGHEADGKTPAERAKEHEYDYCLVLENIAWQYNSEGFATEELSQGLVKGWQESPGHRKNMLHPDATETGVAVAYSSKTERWYAVQMFGRPKSAAIQFEISNQSKVTVNYTMGEEEFTLEPRYTRTHMRCSQTTVTFPKGTLKENEAVTLTMENGKQYLLKSSESGLSLTTSAAESEEE